MEMEILFVLILIIGLLYFFGVFDNDGFRGAMFGVGALGLLAVVIYIVFATLHKYIGPFIFGG